MWYNMSVKEDILHGKEKNCNLSGDFILVNWSWDVCIRKSKSGRKSLKRGRGIWKSRS